MATRSRIGIQLSDNSILSVYHHWDGYPQWLGVNLKEHFNTYDKVSELIDGGDMSCCWTNQTWESILDETKNKDYYGPQYYSERGEDCPPRLDSNLNDYLSNGEEYAYVFSNDEWICYTFNVHNKPVLVDIPDPVITV